MLNITSAVIFSSLMLMLLFRKIPTREEEPTSPNLPSMLLSSPTHVIILLYLVLTASCPRTREILQNF